MNQVEQTTYQLVRASSLHRPLSGRTDRHMKRRRHHLRLIVIMLIFMIMWSSYATWPHVEAESSDVRLSDQQTMENYLANELSRRETMIHFKYEGTIVQFNEVLTESLNKALYSDPFIRYNVSRYTFHWKSNREGANVTIYVQYRETYEQYKQVRQYAKEQVKKLISIGTADEDIVKILHDEVVKQLVYDETLTKFTAYEAITIGKTVCQGYALLLQAMFEEAGITSRVVEGYAGGTLHAWNMVQLNGKWYHIDATWNDPLPDKRNRVLYTYYLLSDKEIGKDHTWDRTKAPQAEQSFSQVSAALP